MQISQFCIQRPVFATVINLLILLMGLVTYRMLTVREYPNVSIPVVNVETSYRGANAEIIETQITQPLEDVLSGIEGIDYISSQTLDEKSQITLRFLPSRDIEAATNDVRDKVSTAKQYMPSEADDAVISKVEADADPIIWLAFSSNKHNLLEITDYADRYVKDKIGILPGVARVFMVGERKYAMRIWLDNKRLSAYQATVEDVANALTKQHIEIPGGRIESADREYSVLVKTELTKPNEFANIIIKDANGYLVRLGDVAKVELGPRDERFLARYNNNNTLGMGIIKQSTANPLDIAKALKKELTTIVPSLPDGMKVEIAYDSTENIIASIKGVYKSLIEAIVLVVLVIFFFLRSARATFIPLVTIPLALIGSFGFMYAFNFSVNTLTLLAMVLAIGLVVDDAIVVLENIYRHIEEGETPLQAAVKGMKEISSAVVAMTLTLVAVFIPITFMEGRLGKLFTEFCVVLAGSVLISGFTALTLSPMMCSRLLKNESKEKHNKIYLLIENGIHQFTERYRRVLTYCLHNKKWVLIGMVVAVLLNGLLYYKLPSEVAPQEDHGFVFAMGIAPDGSTVQFTDRYFSQINPMVKSIPEINRYFYVVGYPNITTGMAFMGLKDWDARRKSQQQIVESLAGPLFGIPGVMAFAMNPPSSLEESSFQGPVEFVLQVSGENEEVQRLGMQLLAKARENPKLMNVDSNLKIKKPQLLVTVNRDKAALSGVSVDTIGNTLSNLLGDNSIARFQKNGKQYDIVIQAGSDLRQRPEDILDFQLRTKNGEMVPLSNYVKVQETVAPVSLNHFNKLRSVTLTAHLAPGYSLKEALSYLQKAATEVTQSKGQYDFSGTSRVFMSQTGTMYFIFCLALVVIYMVLAAQFESLIDPLIIMLSVPLGILGGLILLNMAGGSSNIFSQIGLITLVGLITKHGVLIVQFSNALCREGKDTLQAVLEASVLRLRPILMTTGAMVLGAIPLALATGAGAKSRSEIGLVIVGGMLIGTLFTLIVVPVFYLVLAKYRKVNALVPI